MLNRQFFYEFDIFRFFPESLQLEVVEKGSKINLSPMHSKFLLALLKKSPQEVTYQDFNQEVWVHFKSDDHEALLHTIQSTKSSLMAELKKLGGNPDLIKSSPQKGYFLDAQVQLVKEKSEIDEWKFTEERKWNFLGRHTAQILMVSGIYGISFAVALVLEIAYQFDRYGRKALFLALLSFGWIAVTTLLSLSWTEHLVEKGRSIALAAGIFGIIASAGLLCLALSFFLPQEPITAASFQTQTALGAYLKNVFFYFVPPFLVSILIPFHLVVSLEREIKAGQEADVSTLLNHEKVGILPPQTIYLRPLRLGFLLAIFTIFSLFSSYYLLDHLQSGIYHNLFIMLLIIRGFSIFLLCLVSLLWYDSALNRLRKILKDGTKISIKPAWIFGFWQNEKQKLVTAILLIGGLSSIYVIGRTPKNSPFLESLEIISRPVIEKQFFVRLNGQGFNPETVNVRVIGNGCPAINPCLVPNGALKQFGTQSETELDNIPLTLGKGKYILYAQNGDSPFSNGLEIEVESK